MSTDLTFGQTFSLKLYSLLFGGNFFLLAFCVCDGVFIIFFVRINVAAVLVSPFLLAFGEIQLREWL